MPESANTVQRSRRRPRPALTGFRVLDLSQGMAGPFATHLFAAFGADVLKIESAEGDRSAWAKLYPVDAPSSDNPSPVYRFLNASKRVVRLDLRSARDSTSARRLACSADILVEDMPPGALAEFGLDFPSLRPKNPGLVYTSISDFGFAGPYRDWRMTELIAFAMSGLMSALGEPAGTPVMGAGYPTLYHAGLAAATVTLAAAMLASRTGAGQSIEISLFETAVSMIEILLTCTSYSGRIHHYLRRTGGVKMGMPSGAFACADGHIVTGLANVEWPRMCDLIGRPDLAADPRFQTVEGRTLYQDELNVVILPWFLERTKQEVFLAAQQRGLGWGPVLNIEEIVHDPQFESRRFLGGQVSDGLRYPRPGVVMDGLAVFRPVRNITARSPRWRPFSAGRRLTAATSPNGQVARLPLEGVRVLDLTVSWAGPRTSMIMADLGADVIKIEAPRFVDVVRGVASAVEEAAEYPGGVRGDRYWEQNARFNTMSRNKRCISLDLSKPEGRRLFDSLVGISDVVLLGFRPSAADRLGLSFESLKAVNPSVIVVSLPLFGASGPYRNFGGFGIVSDAMSGSGYLRGEDPDGEPQLWFNPDVYTGMMTPFAVLAALERRQTIGAGEFVDVSHAEVAASLLGEYFLDYQRTGRIPERRGNRHVEWAPHGAYPCLASPGQPDWIAIAVATDDQWIALANEIGSDSWAADVQLSSRAYRWNMGGELDARIANWTRQFSCLDLVARLQGCGIPTGPVHTPVTLLTDPHLRSRGFFQSVSHPAVGTFDYPGSPWRADRIPFEVRWISPVFGEYTDAVLGDLLGLPDRELESLRDSGVTGDRPNGA